jgi:O-antigen/teichoic acid export membrane protein
VASPPVDGTTTLSLGGQLKSTFQDIRHLGQSAILAFLYGRLDVWAISSVANTAGMSQYLLTQRLTSGPLMLAATISNSLIPILASQQEASGRGALRSSQLLIMGYISALTANVCVMSTGPLLHAWLRAPYVNHGLLFLQAGVAALQIVNAVHAAQLLATQQAPQLFRVARVNTAVALIAFPAAMWWGQVQAIATALLVTEGAGTVQHLAFYRRQAKVMR